VTLSEKSTETMKLSDEAVLASGLQHESISHWALLVLAVCCVWRPVETYPSTAVLVAFMVLGLAVWAWRRTPVGSNRVLVAGGVGCVLWASGMAGWDPASAVVEIALLAATVALIWMASRVSPPERWPALLALAISALALWGLWQVVGGMEQASSAISELPEEMQLAAAERLASGRAFASQLLPSHLAVLLATALPILLARVRAHRFALPWAAGSILCVIGLVLTRSPIGAALALLACSILALRRRRRLLRWVVLLMVPVLVVVVVGRGDVLELEPVQLRLDNWRTAVWVWSKAPAAGVGVGGFAQAAQAVPFEVGNRPRHVHSLPLEWLAELGPIGLLTSVLAVFALWRLLRRLWPKQPELAVALAVVPAHNLVDFSLYGSGVTLAWAVLLGWAMAIERDSSEPVSVPAPGRVILVAVVTAALAMTILHVTSIAVEESAAIGQRPTERMDGALQACRLAPWRVDPLGAVAAAALDTGDPDRIAEAVVIFDRSRWLRPRSAALAGLRARLALSVDGAPTAVAEAWAASSEQPTNENHHSNLRNLLHQLESGAQDVGP
jgi:O-antigen ligase